MVADGEFVELALPSIREQANNSYLIFEMVCCFVERAAYLDGVARKNVVNMRMRSTSASLSRLMPLMTADGWPWARSSSIRCVAPMAEFALPTEKA